MALGRRRKTRVIFWLFACALLLTSVAKAQEQDVVLTTETGDWFSGSLLNFDQEIYTIKTSVGVIELSADKVECTGDACPAIDVSKQIAVAEEQEDGQAGALLQESARAEEPDFVISGSSTMGVGLMPLLVSGYASFLDAEESRKETATADTFQSELIANEGFGDPVANIRVRSSVSSDAFANLIGKSAHLGMASRRITQSEARSLSEFGAGNMIDPQNEHIIAIDSLVIIVHPSNPVSTVSIEQVKAIFNGTITNWSELGGSNAPINVIDQIDASGSRTVFDERIFPEGLRSNPESLKVGEDNVQASNLVNADVNAISYVSNAYLRGNQPLTVINECGLPMTPDTFSARTEEYGLQRFLYLYSRSDTVNPAVEEFLKFSTSNYADEVIAKSGFIDLGITHRAQPLDGPRARLLDEVPLESYERLIAQDMMTLLPNHDRLSSTFRFRLGSSSLTRRGELNLIRLTDYLEQQPAGSSVIFVGFTDSLGAFSRNIELSEARAGRILQAVRNTAGDRLAEIEMSSVGFGELAPTGCNDPTGGGSEINRRVEVWIKSG